MTDGRRLVRNAHWVGQILKVSGKIQNKEREKICVSGQARTGGDLPRPTGRSRLLGGRDNHYTTETTDKSQTCLSCVSN